MLRRSSWAACKLTARVTGNGRSASRRIPGTRPTVDTVRWRAERPNSSCTAVIAGQSASSLARGSPMPITTTFESRRPCCWAVYFARATCSTSSAEVRCRLKPCWPVAQKVHPIAQPACDEMQTVARSGYSMSTDSIRAPPSTSYKNFVVSPSSASLA